MTGEPRMAFTYFIVTNTFPLLLLTTRNMSINNDGYVGVIIDVLARRLSIHSNEPEVERETAKGSIIEN